MMAVLSTVMVIALAVAALGSLCKGIASIIREYYRGRAILLQVQQGHKPNHLL